MTQLLLTLRFFATGNFLITAGDFSGVLHYIGRLENDPQPPDEIKNIVQFLGNEMEELEESTQPQNNSPAHAFRTPLITEHFALL